MVLEGSFRRALYAVLQSLVKEGAVGTTLADGRSAVPEVGGKAGGSSDVIADRSGGNWVGC